MSNFTLTILFFLSLFSGPSDELKNDIQLSAPIVMMESDLIITEIMYNPNSSESTWEWIEVYNKGLESIDLSGYVLDDNNNSKQGNANILAGTIAPNSTAILFDADITVAQFTEVWGAVNAIPVTGWPGLNNGGDSIGLWDSFESYDGDNTSQVNVIEQVIYENTGNWPSSNDAGSIFLIAIDFDNTLGSNWSLSEDAIETPLGTASSSQELHTNSGLDIGSPNAIEDEEDTTAPTIECPEMVEINHDEGFCSSVVPLLEPGVIDNVSTEFTLNSERSDGLDLEDPFPVGDTMITWSATDEANNTSLPCEQVVRVIELELPIAIAQNITIELDENGLATISPEELDNIETPSFDNCGIETYLASRTEFNCADLAAPVQVAFSVVDANENTSEVTNVFVTVVDMLKPVITCNGDIVTISSNGNPIILEDVTEPVVTDNCDEAPLLSFSRSDQQELNAPFDVGTTTITWQAVDATGNISMCTQTVLVDFTASMDNDITAFSIPEQVGETVIDTSAKTINLLMPIGTDVTALIPTFELSESASSSPELGEVIDFTEPFVYRIIAQNDSEQEWMVTVTVEEDITPPTFDVNGNTEDFVTELEIGATYMVGVISNIVDESATSSEILGDDLVDTTVEGGPYLVTYAVSDGANVTTITETVMVLASMQPTPSVLSFTLVNADTNADLFPLEEDMEISSTDLPTMNLNIRANTSDDAMSVALSLSGDKTTLRTENVFPFALYGDSPAGNYKGSEFGLGSYTVSATAYTEGQLEGDTGEELSLNFQIIEVQRPFVTTWKTDNSGASEDNEINIPIREGQDYNYSVDWGDGIIDSGVSSSITHTYELPGIYEISISGIFPQILMGSTLSLDNEKLLYVNQWGTNKWVSMEGAFRNCPNLDVIALDIPDLSLVKSTWTMFNNASSLIGNSSFKDWDVSSVERMGSMFSGASKFNQDISSWNVSNVYEFHSMFYEASLFNQDISDWDVSSATDMTIMFGRTNFNQDIGKWDVSGVTEMAGMFSESEIFNQDIGSWNVSNVTSLNLMFYGAKAFNQPIGAWNVSNVTNMNHLFRDANSFNQDISSWDVSNVIDMNRTFENAVSFNTDISLWTVSGVTSMFGMFDGAVEFNRDIGNWDVSNVTNFGKMFEGAGAFNQNLENWNISLVEYMYNMLLNAGLSVENYDNTLIGWSNLPFLQNNVPFHGGNSQFCLGEEARQKLIDDFGWVITDGGKSEDCVAIEASADLIAATYLQGAANPNPTGPILRAEEGNRETYLKFDLSAFSGPISTAQLKMQVASDPGFGDLELYLGSNSDWTETGLNGSSKPSKVGEAIASISGTHSIGETKIWDLDVSQISNGGFLTLILTHSNGNDVAFASDETNQAPELIITSGNSDLVDGDGDGFFNDVDCDDDNPDVNPDAIEICDGIDNNCDGLIDEADPEVTCGTNEISADLIDGTYLQGAANPNPTGPILRVEDGIRETYLKFEIGELSGLISEARLEMHVASDPGFGTLEVFLGSDSNWTETNLSGSNKPTIVGNAIGSIAGTHSLGQTKIWALDSSQFPSSGFVTLIVKHSDGNDVAFASDESNLPPKLILTVNGMDDGADELAGSTNALSVAPNPTSTETTLIFTEPTELVMVNFYDILGRLMGSYEGAAIEVNGAYVLDVQALPAGTYYVKAFDDNGNAYQKQVLIKK